MKKAKKKAKKKARAKWSWDSVPQDGPSQHHRNREHALKCLEAKAEIFAVKLLPLYTAVGWRHHDAPVTVESITRAIHNAINSLRKWQRTTSSGSGGIRVVMETDSARLEFSTGWRFWLSDESEEYGNCGCGFGNLELGKDFEFTLPVES